MFAPVLAASQTREIQIAGDSWAYFLCIDKGYTNAIGKIEDPTLVQARNCADTSKLGIQASEWLASDAHRKLISALKQNSKIEFVHLSLGGNDLLQFWKTNLSVTDEANVFFQVYSNISQIIDAVRVFPNVNIILSGYDYPRFIADHPIKQYRDIFDRLGRPEPYQINSALIRFNEYLHLKFSERSDYKSKLFLISHLGLSHFYTGIPSAGVPEGATLSPDEISTIENPITFGGDFRYLAENNLLRNYFPGVYDSFHLSRAGNTLLAEHTLRNVVLRIK